MMLGISYINTLKKLIPIENAKLLSDEIVIVVHPKNLYNVINFFNNGLRSNMMFLIISRLDCPSSIGLGDRSFNRTGNIRPYITNPSVFGHTFHPSTCLYLHIL
jgi:hypothetical protein